MINLKEGDIIKYRIEHKAIGIVRIGIIEYVIHNSESFFPPSYKIFDVKNLVLKSNIMSRIAEENIQGDDE